MIRRSPFALFLLLFLFACQTAQPPADEAALMEEQHSHLRYTPSDVQKMHWLAGAWKGEENGRVVRQLFQFHGGSALEILCSDDEGGMVSCAFNWYEGRFYYGPYRQWVVTWIGEKDVRFDPVRPGLEPMTWTRVSEHQWRQIRHTAKGDETTIMERTEDMQP